MGGSVTVSSVLGEGAQFKIQLTTKCIQKVAFDDQMEYQDNYVLI